MKSKLWLIWVAYIAVTSECYAKADWQSHQSISQAVHQFLTSTIQHPGQDYQIQVARLDSRLRLSQCETPLEPFLPHGNQAAGKVTVGVRCHSGKPWTIYTTASIKNFKEVAVLSKPLSRGAIVSATDVRLERQDVSKLRQGYLTSIDQVINKQLKRTLSMGAILNTSNLVSQKLVKRGQRVSIRAFNGFIDIRMSGQALMDGEAGQRISVRNDNSKRIVEGKVIAPGIIKVNL